MGRGEGGRKGRPYGRRLGTRDLVVVFWGGICYSVELKIAHFTGSAKLRFDMFLEKTKKRNRFAELF